MRLFFLLLTFPLFSMQLGVDCFFEHGAPTILEGKRVGLITNHTGVDSNLCSTIDIFKEHQGPYKLTALFAPEHGIAGELYAEKDVPTKKGALPIYSLHGETKRPTDEMLKNVDILVYDIQDVGVRCYTYASTLFYAMEEAAKRDIPVIVLDRPNPINGVTVDGPLLHPDQRSFVGYIDVPICHGMTIGELARYFNDQYSVGCKLTVVRMKGWKRTMSFDQTGLSWIPTSPHIPDATTPAAYATTSILGDYLTTVSTGVGYTLPFKVVGAPWIDGEKLAKTLNDQNLKGVRFSSYHFQPFFGRHKGKACQGIYISITDSTIYQPIKTQFLILGVLKSLYPNHFKIADRKAYLSKLSGSEEIYDIITEEKTIAWKLIAYDQKERKAFLKKRERHLLY